MLYPCGCKETILGIIDIMWVKCDPTSPILNHIIPMFNKCKIIKLNISVYATKYITGQIDREHL